jgi:hypothetical protein
VETTSHANVTVVREASFGLGRTMALAAGSRGSRVRTSFLSRSWDGRLFDTLPGDLGSHGSCRDRKHDPSLKTRRRPIFPLSRRGSASPIWLRGMEGRW